MSFLNVGQGDSAFIATNNFKAIIDFGNSGDERIILKALKNYKVDSLNAAIVTHPHSDHFGSLSAVLKTIHCDSLLVPQFACEPILKNEEYLFFEKEVKSVQSNIGEYTLIGQGYTIKSRDPETGLELVLEVLAPICAADSVNDMSLVVKLTFGETTILFAGDAEALEEYTLLSKDYTENTKKLDCDILKVGHHGSNTSSGESFLSAVSPDIAVISAGRNNDYGHPHAQTLQSLKEVGAKVYRTDTDGTITICSDGKNTEVFTDN